MRSGSGAHQTERRLLRPTSGTPEPPGHTGARSETENSSAQAAEIVLMENWFEELNRLVPID